MKSTRLWIFDQEYWGCDHVRSYEFSYYCWYEPHSLTSYDDIWDAMSEPDDLHREHPANFYDFMQIWFNRGKVTDQMFFANQQQNQVLSA